MQEMVLDNNTLEQRSINKVLTRGNLSCTTNFETLYMESSVESSLSYISSVVHFHFTNTLRHQVDKLVNHFLSFKGESCFSKTI